MPRARPPEPAFAALAATDESSPASARRLTAQAFDRAAGAPLVAGNTVRLLRDAAENYPAWLDAIRSARERVHAEVYILADDATGREFAEALVERAREGIRVRLVYDWLGALARAGRSFWRRLRAGGVEVRAFNPPSLLVPFDVVRRNHRKSIVVDDEVAFVTGLCIADSWPGDPRRGVEPWRDTGIELRGPAVLDVAQAFADTWAETGEPLPAADRPRPSPAAGDVGLRVVAGTTLATATFRLDTLVAALAERRLWLADAYFAGTAAYVQALRAAAQDGVDVRLLVPGAGTDNTLVQTVSRAGYRALLEAGIRVFEWNGPMMHAKTAVADGHWARIGSTNLNVASWMGNWELDVVVEDDVFGAAMEWTYEQDLANSTEIVLAARRLVGGPSVRPLARSPRRGRRRRGTARARRAAAGAVRLGYTIGAAVAGRRTLGAAEAALAGRGGVLLVALAIVTLVWPLVTAIPAALLCAWLGLSLLVKAWRLRRR